MRCLILLPFSSPRWTLSQLLVQEDILIWQATKKKEDIFRKFFSRETTTPIHVKTCTFLYPYSKRIFSKWQKRFSLLRYILVTGNSRKTDDANDLDSPGYLKRENFLIKGICSDRLNWRKRMYDGEFGPASNFRKFRTHRQLIFCHQESFWFLSVCVNRANCLCRTIARWSRRNTPSRRTPVILSGTRETRHRVAPWILSIGDRFEVLSSMEMFSCPDILLESLPLLLAKCFRTLRSEASVVSIVTSAVIWETRLLKSFVCSKNWR